MKAFVYVVPADDEHDGIGVWLDIPCVVPVGSIIQVEVTPDLGEMVLLEVVQWSILASNRQLFCEAKPTDDDLIVNDPEALELLRPLGWMTLYEAENTVETTRKFNMLTGQWEECPILKSDTRSNAKPENE